MQHVDEGTIHAWLDGALDPEEAARVEQHARECATCGAAVAEARGLVAGASRILTALDHTPGGVVPRGAGESSGSLPLGATSSGSAPLGSSRRSGSLWRVLHFTPARAAAAAVLILAAGSVMVYRHAPQKMAEIDTEAGPQALEAERRPNLAASQLPAAAPPTPAPAAAPERAAPKLGAPAQNMPARGEAAVVARDTTTAVASPAPQPAREMAVEKRAAIVPNVASTSNAAPSAPQAAIVGGARPAARKAESGGVAGAVETSRAEAAPRALAQSPTSAIVGCYTIEADSLAGLPQRVALDSSSMRVAGFDAVSSRRDSIARSRAALADAVAPIPAPGMHPVRIFDRATFGYAAPAGAYWQAIASDGLRLYIPGGSAAMPIDLRASSPTTFTGTTTIANRSISVTLKRLTDCPAR